MPILIPSMAPPLPPSGTGDGLIPSCIVHPYVGYDVLVCVDCCGTIRFFATVDADAVAEVGMGMEMEIWMGMKTAVSVCCCCPTLYRCRCQMIGRSW